MKLTLAALCLALFASLLGAAAASAVWVPRQFGTTWQWQIVEPVTRPYRAVEMYDIDLQDAVPRSTRVEVPGFGSSTWPAGRSAGAIEGLHAEGKTVICYLDTGAWERYRPDQALFPGRPGWVARDDEARAPSDVILRESGWEEEFWLDLRTERTSKFAPIIWARLDLARSLGCDGIEGDQNNPIGNNPGPTITRAQERAWYLRVAAEAHARGLSAGMKNGVEVTDRETAAAFDWNLNEECVYYEECETLEPFVTARKAIFNTEYTDDWRSRSASYRTLEGLARHVCPLVERRFSTLIKLVVPDTTWQHCW